MTVLAAIPMGNFFASARPRPGRAILSACLAIGVMAGMAAGCGKKGPPLAPLLRLPAPADQFSARRLGSTVYLQFVIPTKNQDNAMPADLARVDVYGYTGTPASDDDMVKYGTLVATVPVRRPPPPVEEDRARGRKPPPRPQSKPVATEPGFDQGATVAVTETVTPALVQPVVVPRPARGKAVAPAQGPVTLAAASLEDVPARVYVAVGVNHKGRRGSFSPHVAVPVVDAPPPPTDVKPGNTETQITLAWTPPPGAPVVLLPDTDAPYLPSKPIVPPAAPGWFYDVFDVPPAATAGGGAASGPAAPANLPRVEPPIPLNPQPLTSTAFTDPRPIEFGTERCYAVRTVNVFGRIQQESEASAPACITPSDTFPPAPPKGLIAVAGDAVISLSWDPNTESDLGGYLVLRGEAPGGTLQPLTPQPIRETSYEDRSAKPGVRYVYAVVAVDKATPPNVSAQSNRIEETAR